MTEPNDWMTKQDVAEYLGISVRQVTRLDIPRAMVGRLPRYSRITIDDYLAGRTYTPRPKAGGAARRTAPRLNLRTTPTDVAALVAKLKRDLGR